MFIRIQGVQHYLWRAVDQDGVVLDILVQARRDANAAKRFFRRLLKGLEYVPRVIVTDKLRSYGVARRQLLPERRASTKPISEQSGRKLTSADTTTRAADATVQIVPNKPGLPLRSLIHLWPLPSTSASTCSQCLSRDPVGAFKIWHQETCTQRAA